MPVKFTRDYVSNDVTFSGTGRTAVRISAAFELSPKNKKRDFKNCPSRIPQIVKIFIRFEYGCLL